MKVLLLRTLVKWTQQHSDKQAFTEHSRCFQTDGHDVRSSGQCPFHTCEPCIAFSVRWSLPLSVNTLS